MLAMSTAATAVALPVSAFQGAVNLSAAGNATSSDWAGVDFANCVPDPLGGPDLCGGGIIQPSHVTLPGDDYVINASAQSNGIRQAQGYDAFASATGLLTFYAVVTGPANIEVPILFHSAWNFTTTGSSHATGRADLFGACVAGFGCNGDLSFFGASYSGLDSQPTPWAPVFSGSQAGAVPSNTLLKLQISLQLGAGNSTFVGGLQTVSPGSVQAWMDPVLEIDPAFTQTGYAVLIGPAPVPEPSSLTLGLAGGLAGLALARMGRRTRAPRRTANDRC
jgi:hypothetical protein